MWDNINHAWKRAFEMGWEAFQHGSIPIGAVIVDENDTIISTGRNRIFDGKHKNPQTEHAETEALRNLDVSKYPDVYQYTLYTSMEPCPMCIGTFVMANLQKLRIAARDSYCGAVHYVKEDPYIISKNIDVIFEGEPLETIQLVLQTYHELRLRNGAPFHVLDRFEQDNPSAIQIGKKLYQTRYLDECVRKDIPFSEVFNTILGEHK